MCPLSEFVIDDDRLEERYTEGDGCIKGIVECEKRMAPTELTEIF